MDTKEKEVFNTYLSDRKIFKSSIEEFLSELKDNEEEKERFMQFHIKHKGNNDLQESIATSMVMDIMKELDFPNNWKNFDELIFLQLEEYGYSINEEDKFGGDPWHSLVDDNNGYWSIATSHGDLFVIDCNLENQSLKIADHSCHITREEHVNQIYSEHFGLWFNEDTNTYINKNNLLLNKVFDKDGNYNLDAQYIKEFLLEELTDTGVNYYMLANYIISELEDEYLRIFEIDE